MNGIRKYLFKIAAFITVSSMILAVGLYKEATVSIQAHTDVNKKDKSSDKDKSNAPDISVDFSNYLTVKEFTTQLLEALGKESTMEYAKKKGYVLASAEYGSYDKPILKREAVKIMAKLMDDLTNVEALFTSDIDGHLVRVHIENHRLQPDVMNMLVNSYGYEYIPLIYWEKYIGNIKDIRMITEPYQKEMVTLYLAGILDTDKDGYLNPYSFITKEEGKELINKISKFCSYNADEILKELPLSIRNVKEKSMPKVEKPSNAKLWHSISPYVNKRLYEYPLRLKTNVLNKYNKDIKYSILERYIPFYVQYFNNRYTFDYRNLNAKAKYGNEYFLKGGTGNYQKRVLFYHNPGIPTNGYLDEKGNDRKVKDMIFADTMIKKEIEK